jgi:hypothetical protein
MAKKVESLDSKALRKYWKPKEVVNESHAKSLRLWLEKHADGVDIATFIHSSAHTKQHAKARSALVKKNPRL